MQVSNTAGSVVRSLPDTSYLSNRFPSFVDCGNAFSNGGGPATDGLTGCNMPCNGNSSEYCGGSNRLDVYKFGAATSSTSTISSSASTTSTTSTSTSSATSLPTGWKYIGCYIDNADGHILLNQQPDNAALTVESCVQTCKGLGYGVAGMEYSSQCFCDNFLHNGGNLTTDADCNMACSGNASEKCGAGNRMSIYANGNLQVYQPPAPQKTGLPGSWAYQGCLLYVHFHWSDNDLLAC